MKKYFIGFLAIILARDTNGQDLPPQEQLSRLIANRMKDSLTLTSNQRNQLYQINIQLHDAKSGIRQTYAGSDSLLTVHIQRIENARDSLYRPVLGEEKYFIYKQKKRNLVTTQ